MLEWFGIEFPDRVVKVCSLIETAPCSWNHQVQSLRFKVLLMVAMQHQLGTGQGWLSSWHAGLLDANFFRDWQGYSDHAVSMQFRDYFGKVVGRCREKVRMKEGLDCDSRVLRMRYSSQDWVSSAQQLCLTRLTSAGICRPLPMPPFLVPCEDLF